MAEDRNTPAEFFGTPVRIIDHAGRRWLTAEEAGLCLGYNPPNASAGIRNLYNRHQDEFTEDDVRRINLMRRDGKPSESLIFSATGCNLLGFFASTPRAKECRAWAKQHLAGHRPTGDGNTPAVAAPAPSDKLFTRQVRARRG